MEEASVYVGIQVHVDTAENYPLGAGFNVRREKPAENRSQSFSLGGKLGFPLRAPPIEHSALFTALFSKEESEILDSSEPASTFASFSRRKSAYAVTKLNKFV